MINDIKIFFQKNRKKTIIYACAFLIPFLMVQAFFVLCGIYPYGPSSILTGDMDVEFVNFYAYFINTLKSSNDWSYMFTKTLGGDFPGLAAFQLHDPLLFILLLFPGDRIAAGIELVFSLQISIAGLFASVLLNNRYKTSAMSLLFSTAYAFSSFFFGYLVLTIYFGALAILPAVLYFFLEYLDDKRKFPGFVISLSLYIFLNYHMGFMMVIFLAILYISRIIKDTKYIKMLPHLILSGVTVLLTDGYFLLRTGLSLLGEKTTKGADYGLYRRFPMNQLFAGYFAGCSRSDLRPLIYCSVAVFFFAAVYFFSKKYGIREKLADLFVMAAVAVSMWINTIDAVWHGFNNPEGFYWRYAYYMSIMAIIIGYKGFIYLTDEGDKKERSKVIWICGALLIIYLIYLVITKNIFMDVQREVINVIAVAAVVLAAVLMIRDGKMRIIAFSVLFILSCSEMIYNAKTSYLSLNADAGKLPEYAKFTDDHHNIEDVISYVKKNDDGFYRIEKDFDRAINDPSMFDYIGLSHDSSCEKDEILDWLTNFGFCKTVYFTYYNGGSTSFVDDLFGVKYFISRFDSIDKPYKKMSYEGKYHAYKNDTALPMAYFAPEGLKECDIEEGNTFEKQNRIASYWTGRPVFIKAEPNISLEGAKKGNSDVFTRTEDEGYIVYDIRITENDPLYFYFYAPRRQEGEVFVNGQSMDVYFTVNHWNTLCAGTFEPGDTVTIKMKIVQDELEISEACFYYEDKDALNEWKEAAKKLDANIHDVNAVTSSHLKFTTDDQNEERTVIISMPYEDSWRISIDGNRVKGEKALGMLMSFTVPKGEHDIELEYVPEGTAAGLALSAAGVILFVIMLIYLFRGDPRFGNNIFLFGKTVK